MTPSTTPTESAKLFAILDKAESGMSARFLATMIYGVDTESTRRKIRKLASESNNRVVSGPDFGYRSALHATPEQFEAAANSLDSQAFKMHARAQELRSAAQQKRSPQLNLKYA